MNRQFSLAVELKAHVWYDEEKGLWTAWCPALDIRAPGATEEECRRLLNRAVRVWLQNAHARRIA